MQFDECDVGLLGHPRPQGRVERRELLRRAATGGARGRLARGATATESLVNIRNTDPEHRRRRISAKAAIHCRNHTLTQVRRIRRAHASLRVDSIYAEKHSSTSRRTPIDSINRENALDPRVFEEIATRLSAEGKTALYVCIDGELRAILAVADAIKPMSIAAIHALHEIGVATVMITGDNERTARAIAAKLGIDEVIVGVMPDGKVAALQRLRAKRKLAFVGDGVNDAPALAAAHAGIAIGTGADIAIEAADVVLTSGDLAKVPTALALSRATMRNVAQNLFWAFAYNVILIPVAAGALYPVNGTLLSPMLGAGSMALSSVFVLTNALRLRRFRTPFTEKADMIEASAPAIVEKTLETGKEAEMPTTFEVKEMTCHNCAKHVTKAVKTLEPAAEVKVDLATGKVDVTPSPKDPEALAKAITGAGYPVKVAA